MSNSIIGGGRKSMEVSVFTPNVDKFRPIKIIGIATRKPAKGPLYPKSNNAFRLGIGDLTFIKAPKVPIIVGAGIK